MPVLNRPSKEHWRVIIGSLGISVKCPVRMVGISRFCKKYKYTNCWCAAQVVETGPGKKTNYQPVKVGNVLLFVGYGTVCLS